MSPVLEWLNKSIEKIEHKIFKDVVKTEDVDTKPMGDGQIVMISDIKRITLTLHTKNGEKKTIKAIFKVEANSDVGRSFAADCEAFTTESMMYGDVLKSMERVMLEIGDENYIWPDCYHCGDNKFLFQDLCEEGYKVVPTHEFLDLDHALIVMKAIGKFHGISLIMKQRNLLKSENFKVPYYARKLPMMDLFQKQAVEHLVKTMKEKWEPEWSSIGERLLKYLEKPGELMFNAWESTNGKWDVLNHGDFTMRNMMFHYPPDSKKPDAIKFVDFQMCHYSNLANDLTTLLYTSMRPRVREEHLEYLLETYVNSLKSTTNLYDYKGPLPTVQDIKNSLRVLTPLIVTNCIISIPFFIFSGKEDLQKKADEYFEKYNVDDITNNKIPVEETMITDFDDIDVKDFLQFELRRCVRENLF